MKKIIVIIACLLMITMLFVSCDKNSDNNGENSSEVASSSDVVTEVETIAGGEKFAEDNEAIYKDSWK